MIRVTRAMADPVRMAQRSAKEYVDAWNEPDEADRRALLERACAEEVTYIDPSVHVEGRDALVAHSRRFTERWPGASIVLSGLDYHHGFLRFGWQVVAPDGQVLREGVDFGELGDDGRLQRIVGFFEPQTPRD